MFKNELKMVLKLFENESNEFATLQDFVSYLLAHKVVEIDEEALKIWSEIKKETK